MIRVSQKLEAVARAVFPALKLALLALVFIFLYMRLRDEFTAIGDKIYDVSFATLIASVVFMFFYQVASIGLWQYLTKAYGQHLPFLTTAAIWSFSALGKYVPGKALLWGIRFAEYKRLNPDFRAQSIVHCFLIEYLSNLIAGISLLLVSLIVLPVKGFDGPMLYGAVLIFAMSCIAVHPRTLHGLTAQLTKRFGVSTDVEKGLVHDTLKTVLLSIFNWFLLGFTVYVICIAVSPATQGGGYLYVTSSYALAGMAGFLAFFAPSGIGVREAILIEALSSQMSLQDAGLVAALSRIVSTIGELGSAAIFSALKKMRQSAQGS